MSQTDKIKGAFKNYPVEQQPIRIPVGIYDQLASCVLSELSGFGEAFVPSVKKTADKPSTGDLDVIIHPVDRQTWQDTLKAIFEDHIVVCKSNGPQLMCVMRGLIDENQYMIDFILAKEDAFEYRKRYSHFGTLIPAVVGSFARSLGYKFDQNCLAARLKSAKGNFHNIKLTSDFPMAMEILGLDMGPVERDNLYTPEKVAEWILASPRFDSDTWKTPPSPDGQTIVTKNRKSHRAVKTKPEVKRCYEIVDAAVRVAVWNNTGFQIERRLLGDKFIDDIIAKVRDRELKEHKVVSGHEIMEITGITDGPSVGRMVREVKERGFTREDAIAYLQGIASVKSGGSEE